jgi:hypothetical protein
MISTMYKALKKGYRILDFEPNISTSVIKTSGYVLTICLTLMIL